MCPQRYAGLLEEEIPHRILDGLEEPSKKDGFGDGKSSNVFEEATQYLKARTHRIHVHLPPNQPQC